MKSLSLHATAILLGMLLLLSMVLIACDKTPVPPSDTTENVTEKTTEDTAEENTEDATEGDTEGSTEADTEVTTEENTEAGTDEPAPAIKVITIAEALELCGEPGNITTDRYYIRGTVQTVKNGQYGQMVVADETGSIEVYGTYSADGSIGYAEFEYKPVKGDEVLLHCILQNYNGTKEVKNARLIEYKNNQADVDVSQYTAATIPEARAAEKGASLKITGVVARITYATGMKPSGFILMGDGSSIYVYDGDAAQRVQIGNTVTVAGTKDYWILDSEIAGAEKFGYKGCNQLTDCILVENDNKVSEINFSDITEITVKELLNTPVTEDITTLVYKVNALVKEVPGNGFTNFYFFDLDGETGNYTYSQCNGNDFEWLREFDGKICTVYITALNAKSTGTSCTFRFLPVAVIDEGYVFDTNKAPEFVLEYHVLDLFKTEYTGNPLLEVPTSLSSALLGFDGVNVTYSSSNEKAVKFVEADGKLVMECPAAGKATVTVTASYNGKSATEAMEIEVITPEVLDATNVADAIQAQVGDTVTVKGIVGPSLVNRNGFYLIDETGLISVIVDDVAIFSDIEIGQEIVIKGKRDKFHNGEGNHAGQTAITGATVIANYYGQHAYDDSHFVTDKTL
ncbi:MAG: OB-fold nucleic acid binding domain-containing protein, partial [Clostridia bacterium]|nr:OB-fold nucleic acid binding domain-containing protein [Clostridia bacterium]